MSVSYYDIAFLNKLKAWIKDEKLTITGPDETARLFKYKADIGNDAPIPLPLIALTRGRDIDIDVANKRPLTFDGLGMRGNNKSIQLLNGVPIVLRYQIDIYTRYEEECNEYVRNFVFNLINYNTLDITIPYNDLNFNHRSKITLNSPISNTSDIPERLIPGEFTRYTLSVTIDDAYLFSAPIKNTIAIEVETKLRLKDQNVKNKGEQ